MTKTNRLLVIFNVLLALILVLLIVQFAPKPANAATGDIVACANKKTGALRLATKACTKKENSVSWGATGPAGPAGPAGARGATGAAGSTANLLTETVTLRYLGDPNTILGGCGSGYASFYDVKVYDGYWISTSDLTNSLNWATSDICSITLKVLR